MSGIFERYAPFVQDFIYANGWEKLRAVQVAAGDAIFNSDDHVLICASTASGKTEAAFFPILSLLAESPPASVGVLYIAPLKALINDQFERLQTLAFEGGIPVWAWHGDVAQSRKRRLLEHPSGILQITPESLEALLLRKHGAVAHLFKDLRFIVIDELHALMRGDRGAQTLCLIERLSRLSGTDPRRIGLSATIGDTAKAAAFLRGSSARKTRVPQIVSPPAVWRLSVEHFFNAEHQAGDGTPLPENPALFPPEGPTDQPPASADPGIGYIFAHTRGKKCLVFSNSREECESVTSTLRQYSRMRGEPERFLIHHGNLSTALRTEAEALMKDDSISLTTCTTATLELGIDIGRLERAFQIDAPFTVSGFLQRLGRTGRRGSPPEMRFVMREDEPEARALLPVTIPWTLLQGIALIECYREEKWVEPPNLDRLPFSLLYHQTMAALASEGEMRPAELAARVLTLSPFRKIGAEDYKTLLRHLIETDQIQKTETGGLIVGLAGERIIGSFKFYAVFKENEEFTVRCESQELGTIVAPPPVGEKIAIAGRVWVVEEVDRERHTVWCHLVDGKVPAYFGLCPGDIHTKILEKMLQVLQRETVYPYLMRNAVARLASARHAAALSGMTAQPLVSLGGKLWCLFPWLGTYAFMALERLIRLRAAKRIGLTAFDSSKPYFMEIRMQADAETFFAVLEEEAEALSDPMTLLYPDEVPYFEKYDDFLPAELIRKGFAYGVLGTNEMKARVAEWRAAYRSGFSRIAKTSSEPALLNEGK